MKQKFTGRVTIMQSKHRDTWKSTLTINNLDMYDQGEYEFIVKCGSYSIIHKRVIYLGKKAGRYLKVAENLEHKATSSNNRANSATASNRDQFICFGYRIIATMLIHAIIFYVF